MPRKSEIQAEEVAAVSSPVRRSTRRAATPSNTITSENPITTKAVRTRRSSQDSSEKNAEKIDLKATRARRAASSEPTNEEEKKPIRGRRPSVTDESKTETPKATRARRSSVTGKSAEEIKVDSVTVDETAKGTPKVTRRRRSLSVDIEEPIINETKLATRSRRLSTEKQEEIVQTPAKKTIRTRRSSVEKLEETEPKTPKTRRRASISLDPINEQSESSRKSQSPKTEVQDVVIKLTPLKKTVETAASQLDLSIIQEDSLLEDHEEKPQKIESRLSDEKSPKGENTSDLGSDINEASDNISNVIRKSPRLSSGKKSTSPLKHNKSFEVGEKLKETEAINSITETIDNTGDKKSQSDLNSSSSSDKENISETMVDSPKMSKMSLVLTEVNKISEIPAQDITVARVSNVFRPRGIEYSFAEPMEVDELENSKIAVLDKTSLEESKSANAVKHDESVDESFKLIIETTNVDESLREKSENISLCKSNEPENSDTRKLLLTSEHEKMLEKIHLIEEDRVVEEKTNDITDYEFHIQSDDDQTDDKFEEYEVSKPQVQSSGKGREFEGDSIPRQIDATTPSKSIPEADGEDIQSSELMEVQPPTTEIALNQDLSESVSAEGVNLEEPGKEESSNQGEIVENMDNDANVSHLVTAECEETNSVNTNGINTTRDESKLLETSNENDDDGPEQMTESGESNIYETESVSPSKPAIESKLPDESSKDHIEESSSTENIEAKNNDTEAAQNRSSAKEEEPQSLLNIVKDSEDLDQTESSFTKIAQESSVEDDDQKYEKIDSFEKVGCNEVSPLAESIAQGNKNENLIEEESAEKSVGNVEVESISNSRNENEDEEDFDTPIDSEATTVDCTREVSEVNDDMDNSTVEQEKADDLIEKRKISTETLDGSMNSENGDENKKQNSENSSSLKETKQLEDDSDSIETDANVSTSKLESSAEDRKSSSKSKTNYLESSESKLDKYLSEKLSNYQESSSEEAAEEEEEEEKEKNEFIDDMAMEGEEDTPSEDSNQIVDEGESLHSSDSHVESDDEYDENDSFICDAEEVELLSGEEYDLSDERVRKKKKSRIINVEDNDSDIIRIKKKDKPTAIRKKSRIITVSSSESEADAQSDDDNIKVDEDSNNEENNISPRKRRSTDYNAAGSSTPNVQGSNETTRRSSITIHENVSVKELQDCALSERINLLVGSFCNKIKKGDISMNLSLEYEGRGSESSSSPPSSSNKSPTAAKRLSDQELQSSSLKKMKMSPEGAAPGFKSNLKRRLSKSADNVSEVQNKKKKKKSNKRENTKNNQVDSYSLFDGLLTDVKNRPRRKVKPCKSISELNTSWIVEVVHVKPSTSIVSEKEKEDFKRKKIHPKDFRQQMLYNSSRVRREDTKSMMRKRGVY